MTNVERAYASEAQAAHHRSWIGPKRAFDIAFAALAMLVLLPLLILVALAVKLDSRGPLVFRQRRYGRDMRPFTVLKFRTMHDSAAESHRRTSPASPPARRTSPRASRSWWRTRA